MAYHFLEPIIKEFLHHDANDKLFFGGRLEWQRKMCGYLDRFVYQLKKMMLGHEMVSHEYEEVKGLVDKMEVLGQEMVSHEYLEQCMDRMLEIIEELCNIICESSVEGEEIVVGFDDDVDTLLDQLTHDLIKRFQVISIVGMAGLGKTTLARRLFRDPLIEYHFDIRAWTCVSQKYQKRDLLLGILSSSNYGLTEEIYKMSDEQLGEKMYRLLKGRRYLVVLDDIWDCMAWNDLKIYFPDDKVGSRVLFTSRDTDMSSHVGAAMPAHVLRLRTTHESWEIFQKKVFRTGRCFLRFEIIGKEIAKKCEGLPLAIVIAAGLVKSQLSYNWWFQIANSLSSYMVRDPSQYMDTLALSYNHLPPHLRSCFLFVGVFPEDYVIPVTKLIWLWIAQGFIHQSGKRVLEDVAEDFLMDLIKRSLLMTAEKRVDGQIKSCRIHDLLRDLCLRKAEEEKFSRETYMYAPVPTSIYTITNKGHVLQMGGSIFTESYESLLVLDMESVSISFFPSGVTKLYNLRYLAIQARDGSPHASISKLVNLQMLIILSVKSIVVPKTIWDMVNLRHLHIKTGENLFEEPCFMHVVENADFPRGMGSNMHTLSQISPQTCHNIFSRTPNLRKLGFCGPLISSLGDLEFPNIRSLEHLQKLKLLNTIPFPEPTRSCNPLNFPENLKKLTLSNIGLDWEEMWTFAWLPNLEVLKLRVHACIGEKWETSDSEYRRLKVLKLQDLDLRQWVSSSHNFPRLQCLVVHRCLNLERIPSSLGKILTLDMIHVSGCNASAQSSALEILKEQEHEGNYFLKVQTSNNV